MEEKIAPHEAFEIHELLQLKNICAMKISSITGMVTDPPLRVILETHMEKTQTHIADLKHMLEQSANQSIFQS